MEAGFQGNEKGDTEKFCPNLLDLAANDDVVGFTREVEEMGSNLDEVSFWYGRRFGSKKMGFEERTPIMIASLYGSTQVLLYIIRTGKVDVNRSCGSDGATPLHCAAASGSSGSVEVVKILIDAFGDINAVDSDGKKPCDVIRSSNNSKRKSLEMLLKGLRIEGVFEEGKDGSETVQAMKGVEKKEYPKDVCLPDINNGVYGSDEFRMYSFKVKPCSRAYSHDWTECPFAHPGENARRRDLRKYHYTCVPCPDFKKGSCPKSDSCEYAHGVFESWLHPAQYKTRICKDEMGCTRKVCFFAHKPEELRPVYASTGSAIPSPKALPVNSMDLTATPPGSRLKMAALLHGRDLDLDMELLGLEQIRTRQQRQQLVEEMASLSLSSPYSRIVDLKPTNLDNIYGSPFGFDSGIYMNSRPSSFSNRSQSFIDRSSGMNPNSPNPIPQRLSNWSSPDGKLEWGFNGEEASKFRKSASFHYNASTGPSMGPSDEPDGSWVQSMVKDDSNHSMGEVYDVTQPWIDQIYIEQEQVMG